eukprot:4534741-Amphidinium_carterae.1
MSRWMRRIEVTQQALVARREHSNVEMRMAAMREESLRAMYQEVVANLAPVIEQEVEQYYQQRWRL